MTISQGECPRGTCPGRVEEAKACYSTVISPNLAIPEPCKSALIHQCSSHSQCPKLRARVLW